MDITPIQTFYKGYHFRSRTEARWAVFFDALGWKWQYEAEGFKLPSGWYLPDFYFPDINAYGEVKPKEFTEQERLKCWELKEVSKAEVFLLVGSPDFTVVENIKWYSNEESDDIILVAKGCKYYPYHWGSYMYKNNQEEIESDFGETAQAIYKSRAARFEFL